VIPQRSIPVTKYLRSSRTAQMIVVFGRAPNEWRGQARKMGSKETLDLDTLR